MRSIQIIIYSLLIAARISSQPIIPPPTQTDEIIIDAGTPGSADPNDRIRYKVTIENTGSSAALMTQLNAVLDPRTTLVAGSFRTSPVAFDDAYTSLGNVGITVPDGVSDLLANDYDDNIPGLTLTGGTFTTAQGGSITINANGSFSYIPPRGFEGSDTYAYTLNDGNAVSGVPTSNNGTVTITVAGVIWFINNNTSACVSNCDGRLSNPYISTTAFNSDNTGVGSNPADNDIIFIYADATAYTGGIVLRNGQKLIGEDATVTLAAAAGLTVPPFSNTLPTTNGASAPDVTITNGSGDGVTMAQDNLLRGFAIGNCSDFGMDNTTTNSVGNLVALEVNINNTTGGGFDASNGSGASMNAVFSNITSTGGTNGVDLTSCAGTFTVNGGSITNPTGTGVLILNGSVTFSSGGAITDNTGFAIDVDNHDSNDVTFSGNITSTGTGIRVQNCGAGIKTFSGASTSLSTTTNSGVTLANNTGATINFNGGGLVITTTSGTGFNATGGATAINVTGTGNSINSPTGTALNVSSTTIGSGNLNFQSISSSSSAAPTGIILNTTGGSGRLIVSGTVGSGSGGTIANKTGADGSTVNGIGIYMNSTLNPSFTRMHINDCQNFAIRGTTVNGFTLDSCLINGINGTSSAVDEGAIVFDELTGNPSVTNCTITHGYEYQFKVINTTGVLNRLTMTGTTINGNDLSLGDDAFHCEAVNAAVMNLTIQDCIFTSARGDIVSVNGANNSTIDIVFRHNQVSNNHTNISSGSGGVIISSGGAGSNSTLTYDISCNTFRDARGTALNCSRGLGAGTMSGTIYNNSFGVAGLLLSGSTQASDINLDAFGSSTHTCLIKNNILREYNEAGINAHANNGNSTMNLTVIGNTTDAPPVGGAGVFAFAGFNAQVGALVTDANILNLKIGGAGGAQNNFVDGDPVNFSDVFFSRVAGAGTQFNLSQGVSGSTNAVIITQANNVSPITVATAGTITAVAGSPALPAIINEACTTP